MRQRCEYCGNWIADTDAVCGVCGGPNDNMVVADGTWPQTIDELKAFCAAHNMPLGQMRFFIGEDYRGPRAFGIYRDEATGNCVVYKNKSDGSRAIRYCGTDEPYAVNEILQKMRSEIAQQRLRMATGQTQNNGRTHTSGPTKAGGLFGFFKKAGR